MSVRHPDKPAGEPPKRLTPEEVEEIIECKLNGMSTLRTAEKCGVNRLTVDARWKQWLDETSEDRRANLEQQRSAVISKLNHVASSALREIGETTPAQDRARLLTVARQAIADLSRVAGFDAPKQVQMQAAVTMSHDEALKILEEERSNLK